MKRIIMTVAFVSLFVGLAAAESGNSATGAIANAQYVNTNSLVVKDMTGTKLAHVINTNNRTMQ
ncbi:MAG: hypothetical protein ACRDE2_13815, partial [Chitinophagaceae bacterium]